MQWRGEEPHQATDNNQRKPDLRGARENKSRHARQCAEEGRTNPDDRQRRPSTKAVDEKPAWDHTEGINEQERRIDHAHLFRSDRELFHDPLVPGHRHADAIEVTDETQRHEQRDDSPAIARQVGLLASVTAHYRGPKFQIQSSKLKRNPKLQTPKQASSAHRGFKKLRRQEHRQLYPREL